MKKLFFFLALLLPIGAWAGETVIATDHWAGPYFFSDDGVGATCNMTSEGLAIYNPKVQELLWTPQAMVIADMTLEENHTYKVIVSAKIPSAGKLQLNLSNWESDWDKSISVNASSNFQDFEFLYENCPYYTESGHVMFQNGGIKGTSIVRNVKVLDMTNSGKVIAEKSWDAPYWFDDEGTGATCTITDEGLAITNPNVQEELWKPQTWVLKYAKLKHSHTYKVVVNAKIPSDGFLQVQLGSFEHGGQCDQKNLLQQATTSRITNSCTDSIKATMKTDTCYSRMVASRAHALSEALVLLTWVPIASVMITGLAPKCLSTMVLMVRHAI